ncbi:MAG: hypothetical protein AAF363_12445 [Bacteroidota bacterium]
MIEKIRLIKLCESKLSDTIERLKTDLEKLNTSSEEDTKSSAGDKYETSREMIQQERDKLGRNLQETLKMHQSLKSISISRAFSKVKRGSIVETSKAVYFISVPLGQISVDGKHVFVISPLAPIAQNMLDKSASDFFEINGSKQEIFKVY